MSQGTGGTVSDPGMLALPSQIRQGFVCFLAGAPVIYSLWFGLKQKHRAGKRWMSVPVPFIPLPLPHQAHRLSLIIRQGGRI